MRGGLIRTALIAATASLGGFASAALSGGEIASYHVRIPLRTAPGASIQRIALPGRVLTALQRPDLGDLRVFDATGHQMQIALAGPSGTQIAGRRIPLTTYPILGSPGALKITGLTLKFDGERSARLVGVAGAVQNGETPGAIVLGALLDTRAVANPAAGLLLDADLPASQPITVKVEASPDLAEWQPVAEKVIYRAAAADRPIASETIGLEGVDLAGRYLRITWTADSRLLSPVHVRGAMLTAQAAYGADRISVEAFVPAPADPHQIALALPFGTHVAALRIVPARGTAVIPVRLFGRGDREQPWGLLGEGTVYRLVANGRERGNGAIELPDGGFREIRIEADARSAGFAIPPKIELLFAPRDIAVLLSGTPPFVLAAGSADAVPTYLAIQDLLPDGDAATLPMAVATSAAEPETLTLLPPTDGGTPRQTIVLWAALLLGTAVLGGIVWALYRSMKRPPPIGEPPTV